jgi:hypothetical protein
VTQTGDVVNDVPSDFTAVLIRWRNDPEFAHALLADRAATLAGYRLDAAELTRLERLVGGSPTYDDLLGPRSRRDGSEATEGD